MSSLSLPEQNVFLQSTHCANRRAVLHSIGINIFITVRYVVLHWTAHYFVFPLMPAGEAPPADLLGTRWASSTDLRIAGRIGSVATEIALAHPVGMIRSTSVNLAHPRARY